MHPSQKTASTPLWLAIRFPQLPLDLHNRGQSGAEREPHSGRPDLVDAPRDEAAERQALQRLAAWCYQYSSQVCIPGDRDGLFLEAGASKRLFGRTEVMGGRLVNELGQLGYLALSGSAATPEAAWLAARERLHIDASGQLRRQLGPLPLSRLHLDTSQRAALERMGFRQLRDLLRLPRKALTRRFGPALPDYLDRVLGIRPDPRAMYHPPERFASTLELAAAIHSCQGLLFPLNRLLEELCGVLRGGDSAVQSVHIALGHEDHPSSQITLGLQSPTQDAGRLMLLLRERLERLRLPQAVRDISLQAPTLLKFNAGQHSLFRDTPAEQRQDIERLSERLQARLGKQSVCGLTGVEDHRPEYSWRPRALDEQPQCVALPHRPSWLLPDPVRCRIKDYEIIAGPERIESGWWDGRDCRRDYFIVRERGGGTLWAFREYKPRRGWYLHGIFG
ncbi:MAG: DNA polymerase Y family protein [Xanthomonadales bacterium]|nr:DNA polymerase Y family protein [Gammaproteobacteria bacterium]MBT8052694.1 DNA polymerase Y family protein [Gammaproteobacteria bacterium]NND56785.1 DNA polymerase Y family protein [Xanthomonadales bacterium]